MESSISRRQLVAGTAAIAGGIAASQLITSQPIRENAIAQEADGSLIYEGTAQGLRGEVTVHVTVDSDKIAAVDVVRSTEAPIEICGEALDVVPGRIVDAQSTDVDGITGATFTSNAIISATTAALEAAGVADKFASSAHATASDTAEDIETDILVLGAGGSGCMAALAAKYEDFDANSNDLSVTLVERQGFYGGSSMLSGGSIGTAIPLNDTSNIDKMLDEYMANYEGSEFPANRELTRNLLEISGRNLLQMQALGFPVVTNGYLDDPSTYDSLTSELRRYRFATETYDNGHWPWQGVELKHFFTERFDRAGIDVRLNTEALELVVDDDGAVRGARVSSPEGEYTITAKKVILALGGIAQSQEMLERYAPDFATAHPYTNASCRGDGIRMAVDAVDAVVYGNYSTGMLGPDIHTGFWSDLGAYFPGWNSTVMLVNEDGKRFMFDGDGYDVYESYNLACQQPDATVFAILDSDNAAAARVQASKMPAVQHAIFQADSIEKLATAAGIDIDGLSATVDAYESSYEAGEDDADFGVPNDAMTPVKTAPFYAVALQPYAYATNVGLAVSENCEVLNSAGDIVSNLYAVGEMCWTGTDMIFLGGALASGRLAGEHAKAALE